MIEIFIETCNAQNLDITTLPLDSALIVILYKYLNCSQQMKVINIRIKESLNTSNKHLKIKSNFLDGFESHDDSMIDFDLKPPFLVHSANHLISGFSAVCREMIVASGSAQHQFLLGFNQSCLQAPSEASAWTKFCEIDIFDAFNAIIEDYFARSKNIIELPDAFLQFDKHLKKPLKVNDKYKKEVSKSNIKIMPETKFSEYNHPTLLDFLVFLAFEVSLEFLPPNVRLNLLHDLPLLCKWIENVRAYDEKLVGSLNAAKYALYKEDKNTKLERVFWLGNDCAEICEKNNQSEKYKQINKVPTVQSNIENSFLRLKMQHIEMSSKSKFETTFDLDWQTISPQMHPDQGGVPDSRLGRKKDQLKCLIDIVMSLACDNETIVDFCCGSGHLGIILATLLPKCTIIFLENKQFSLITIKERSQKLNLKNCVFYQSNIDYFVGHFDIGISLHACGTATDVVLLKCIQNRAKFICCPCCYGSINPMPHITYPLSGEYKNIVSPSDYLYLTHAADLTENQDDDIHCMDVIDTDRKLWAEALGYRCTLTRLSPENCTPKNRILIGTL